MLHELHVVELGIVADLSVVLGEGMTAITGETGVSSRHRWRGDTIGPRAEKEYAVEPVGVATITPSAA